MRFLLEFPWANDDPGVRQDRGMNEAGEITGQGDDKSRQGFIGCLCGMQ